MADVAEVVDRHAAHVHAHVLGIDRREGLDGTRKRVVDAQRHGPEGGKVGVWRRYEQGRRIVPAARAAQGLN